MTPDGNTEEFDILAGVLQGDTLAPFLFIIALDHALRKAISGREQELGFTITPRKSRRVPAVVLADLDYADDISLMSDRVEYQGSQRLQIPGLMGQLVRAGPESEEGAGMESSEWHG